MHSAPPLDCAGRRRSPATLSGFHQGRPPRNKGLRSPPDPPTVEEIIAVMRRGRRSPRRAEAARRDRRAVARRIESQRGARLGGERSRQNTWRRAGASREGRQTPRGWNGPLGLRAARSVARDARSAARRRALLRAPRAHPRAPPAPRPGSARCCETPLWRPASGDGSRHTSSATPTQSRCPANGFRWSSSSGNSVMPILGSPPPILRGIDNTEIIHAVHERPAPMIPATTALSLAA